MGLIEVDVVGAEAPEARLALCRMLWWQDRPASLGPSPTGMHTFVARSSRLTPVSRQTSTCRVAPATSVEPTLLNGSLLPKVIVARVSDETNSLSDRDADTI